jgi:hypothetical protein
VSQAQRGINGNVLDRQLQNVARTHGIDNVRAALGPGRLENLQAIADATKTNAARVAFNQGARYVAHVLATSAGYRIAGISGAIGAEGALLATQKVLNAVRTDPAVGRNLLFAIKAGARPENYAPLIAGMIAKDQQQEQPQTTTVVQPDAARGVGEVDLPTTGATQ